MQAVQGSLVTLSLGLDFAEAKMKKDTLKARAQSAKSAAAINDMVSDELGYYPFAVE